MGIPVHVRPYSTVLAMYKALLAGQTAEELDPDLSVRCQVKISEY